jgi:glycine cleavage system H lipoate-binding protein
MNCPYLKESEVEYCESVAIRKLIPLSKSRQSYGMCASPDYAGCPVFQERNPDAQAVGSECPNRRESLMQYCGASPVAKPVPYSESSISRCGSDAHRYCQLYLETAHPEMEAVVVAGIAMPRRLRYAPNHMWLDVTENGICHVGVDAFLARALGSIEAISFVWTKGVHRPAAVLTVAGTDVHLTFPNEIELTGCNVYLRASLSRITEDPYGGGWLFEGKPTENVAKGLLEGDRAHEWMRREERRISDFLVSHTACQAAPSAADGGTYVKGAAGRLSREQMLTLSHEFFSPYAGQKGEA